MQELEESHPHQLHINRNYVRAGDMKIIVPINRLKLVNTIDSCKK